MIDLPKTTTEDTRYIIQTLALNNPDFAEYYASLPFRMESKERLPSELMDDILTVLREDIELDRVIRSLSVSKQKIVTYAIPDIASVGTIVAALFLLRLHIKFERNALGKWEFLIEHKPNENALLEKVLSALAKLLSNSSNGGIS